MRERCEQCGLRFDRGPGYYLGSIYINYGLTAVIVTAGYLALFLPTHCSRAAVGAIGRLLRAFSAVVLSIRASLWLALDLYS